MQETAVISRAFATPLNWILMLATVSGAGVLMALFPVNTLARAPVVAPVILTLLLVGAAQGLFHALGRRHGWVIGLIAALSLAAVPALSLRSDIHARAERYQSADTIWPELRPSGHIALLSCVDACEADAQRLLEAGAYSVFVPDDQASVRDDLPPDLGGLRQRACGSECVTSEPGDLGFNDLAYLRSTIATPDDRYVSSMTRHRLFRQTEGIWTEIARDTTVHLRLPAPWPGLDTVPGKLDADVTVNRLFDLSERP